MKKLFCYLMIIVCSTVFLSGCNKYKEKKEEDKSNGVYKIKIEKNFKIETFKLANGSIIFIGKNNNNLILNVEPSISFYNEKGELIRIEDDYLYAIGPDQEFAVEIFDIPKNYDHYEAYVKAERNQQKTYFDKLEINSKEDNDYVSAVVENKGSERIDTIIFSIVYYKNGKPVGTDEEVEYDLEAGKSIKIEFSYPEDDDFNEVDYDTYKIFINEAYSISDDE